MAKAKLTAGRVAAFECPAGKQQGFLWDEAQRGLALRVTAAGAKAYVFESLYGGRSVRITIGSPHAWTIPKAQEKARELQQLIDQGIDPRTQKAEREAAEAQRRTAELRASVTVADAWPVYMAEGKPRGKDEWKPRYRADLAAAAAPGGQPKKRGGGVTKPGHLAALMPLRLTDIDRDAIRDWYAAERKRAPVQAARAVAMFSGFLTWCANRREYRELVDRDAARSDAIADMAPAKRRREDALSLDHLKPWFSGTDKLRPVARAYLQALVLTGARREEMAALQWSAVDFRWKTLRLADKVGDTRTIPLAPYLAQLLGGLPRVKGNPHVFATPQSKSGRIAEPRSPHEALLLDAGIPHVSIHGLRRTFALLGEAAGAPAGAIAQVMGHRPSAVAEGYKPRTVDALRPYLEQIEGFILGKAGIEFHAAKGAAAVQPPLRRVA